MGKILKDGPQIIDWREEDKFGGFIIDGQKVEMYEPHGYFRVNDTWVLYGHEEIIVTDLQGNILGSQHTR